MKLVNCIKITKKIILKIKMYILHLLAGARKHRYWNSLTPFFAFTLMSWSLLWSSVLLFMSRGNKHCETYGPVISRFSSYFVQNILKISTCSLNIHCSKHGITHRSFGRGFLGLFLCSSCHSWFLEQRHHKYRSKHNNGLHTITARM